MFNPYKADQNIMLPEELSYARKLIDQARFKEALEIIEGFEKTESLSPEDLLSMLLTKSRIYSDTREFEKNVEVSSRAYEISQDLGLLSESIKALIGKASIAFIGELDKAASYVFEAERMLNSLSDGSSTKSLRRSLLYIKSWVLYFRNNYKEAIKLGQECLELSRDQGNKLSMASDFLLLGWATFFDQISDLKKIDLTHALDYAMKSLEYNKDLDHAAAVAYSYGLIARIYLAEGDYDQAMEYCEQSLSIKEISKRGKIEIMMILADIYVTKSETRRSLKYRQHAIDLSKEINATEYLAWNLHFMGALYGIMDKREQAVEYFERCIVLSEKLGLSLQMAASLCLLTVIYALQFEDSREIASRYFSRLSGFFEQTKEKGEVDISLWYLFAKASMMKTSIRIRDRMEAQGLFKELIDRGGPEDFIIYSMGSLCDLLLEELSMNNNPAILEEITPLIAKSLDTAEKTRNYGWLANTKLLQGKLALIRENFDGAKQFLTQAQRIAELHGLHLLAQKVSEEHDKLITQLHEWENLKNVNAPMAEKIKLASTNDVLNRIQGRKAVVPTESVDEQSTVLLILAEGGILVFSYPFSSEWRADEDLFSSFLSAFSTFSNEFFIKGLDRAKFGDDMMLMESIGSFSFCYLFKGQTYMARQKLTKFIKEMQNNSSLWQNLNHHYNTSQVLELRENPQLEILISEIFTSSS